MSVVVVDPETDLTAKSIKAAVQRRFGAQLAGIYLFGSRARGDHRADSDLDVAVVLHDVVRPLSVVDRELLDLTYPLEIERGVHIQAWALPAEALEGEGTGLRARLAATVRREGVPL
jgi:predicted nucleotidyltransferase